MGWWAIQTLKRSARALARALRSETANVAMIYGLAFMPMMATTGAAIDLSRALMVRARLAQALDAAGLAVGASVNLDQQATQTLAQKYFVANYPSNKLGTPGALQVSVTNNVVDLSATASLNTTIMAIFGFNTMTVGATSEITRETKGLEVAMVLDTTGSMAQNGKIDALKSAATDLVDILAGNNNYPDNLKIGIVPFALSVKLDPTEAVNNGWVDTTGQSSVARLNFSGGKYAYWLYTDPGGLSNTPWTGCVEARPNGLFETDTPPDSSNPDTLWVPMFQPDEPHVSSVWFPRDYIHNDFSFSAADSTNDTLTAAGHGMQTGDGPFRLSTSWYGSLPSGLSAYTDYYAIKVDDNTIKLATSAANASAGVAVNFTSNGSGTLSMAESSTGTNLTMQKVRQNYWGKYVGKSYSGTSGPYTQCGMQPITPLTNDKQLLLQRINNLNPAGNTNIPFGLSWGWRLISPSAPYTEGVPYSDDRTIKAIILMTDGMNDLPSENSQLNKDGYSPFGYATQERLGTGINTESAMETEMNASLLRICNNIKSITDSTGSERIIVYTIALMVTDTNTIDRLRSCATSPAQFFNTPTSAELGTVFHTIAQDLTNLRISR
jgi:Flp pilus assembly protein TadG